MKPDEIAAAVKPLRVWLTHSGFGTRGERARAHLDAFEAELNGIVSLDGRTSPHRDHCAIELGYNACTCAATPTTEPHLGTDDA